MKLILKTHNEKYAVLKRKAPNPRKWCSTWEDSIYFAFGHFVKLLYTPGVDLPGYVCISMAVTSWTCKGIELWASITEKKYERVYFHRDVGIDLNCEPITRNYDLVVENLAVAGCLGAACDCWVGIMATSNSQNWGLEGGGVPTLTLAALFPATGSLTWTREENHPVRRRGWQDKIG